MLSLNVDIDAGGAETGVAEQLLKGEDVGAAFQQMRGKAVPQRMNRRRL
jgi:hypothetical protein